MRTIKVTINEIHKVKLKVGNSNKKVKDFKLSCPEEFVTDTITLFKNPELTPLTERNVNYLAWLSDQHRTLLNLKPIFLKKIANLQSEMASVEKEEEEEEKEEEEMAEQPSMLSERAAQIEEASRETDNTTNTTNTTNSADSTNSTNTTNTTDSTDSINPTNTTNTTNTNTTNVPDLTSPNLPPKTKTVSHSISVSQDDDNTIRVKETRLRTLDMTSSTIESDPALFIKIISPKQRLKTKYSSYTMSVVTSPAW